MSNFTLVFICLVCTGHGTYAHTVVQTVRDPPISECQNAEDCGGKSEDLVKLLQSRVELGKDMASPFTPKAQIDPLEEQIVGEDNLMKMVQGWEDEMDADEEENDREENDSHVDDLVEENYVEEHESHADDEEGETEENGSYTDDIIEEHDIEENNPHGKVVDHMTPLAANESAHVRAPHLFFATHHKTGTALAMQLGEAMMKVVADETWGQYLVRGVDWNETGTPGEQLNPPCNYHGCKHFAQDPCPSEKNTGPTVRIFQNINMPTLKRLDTGCGNFRMVHFVRDPVALTVSAYLYHSRVANDTAEPGRLNRQHPYLRLTSPRMGPEVYKKLPLKEGLKKEAALELNTTLRMMSAVHNSTFWRPNVLTVALESFKTDFDGATRNIFEFFLGDRIPKEKLDLLQKHVHAISFNRTSVKWEGHEHITPKEATAHAFEEWNAHRDEEEFRRVQALREVVAYNDDGHPSWSSNVTTLVQIPKILHQSWKDSAVPKSLSAYAATWHKMHPTWMFRFWSDSDNARLWEIEVPNMLALYQSFKKGVMRADASRLLYMFKFGGVYADFDVEPCQNLDKLLNQWHLIFVRSPYGFLSNYFIASLPGHPFWKFALHQLRYADQRLAELRSTSEKDGLPFTIGNETMWTAGPKFLDETLKKFSLMSSQSVINKIKVYEFSAWQAEVGVHHWTGTWHCPGGGQDCTAGENHAPKPTDGVELGVNPSKSCSVAFQQAQAENTTAP